MFIEFHLRYRYIPGHEEFELPYRLDRSVLDDAFQSGGLPLLESVMNTAIGMMFNKLKDELLKPYLEAAEEQRKNAFGPLGAFLQIGRPDIIQKVALEEHERKKGQ